MARIEAHDSGAATVLERTVPDLDATLLALLAEVEFSWRAAASSSSSSRGDESAPGEPQADRVGDRTDDLRHAQADILVVDDDEDVRTSMAAVLRSVGYTVAEAVDGESALNLLARADVGIVLLDLHMAPRDGIWLLERIEATPAVVVVSAFALYDEWDVRTRFSHRVAQFLRKPVAPPRLLAAIRDAFGSEPGP